MTRRLKSQISPAVPERHRLCNIFTILSFPHTHTHTDTRVPAAKPHLCIIICLHDIDTHVMLAKRPKVCACSYTLYIALHTHTVRERGGRCSLAPEQNAFERKFSHAQHQHSHVCTYEHTHKYARECRRSNGTTTGGDSGFWFPRFARSSGKLHEFELYRIKAATWNTRLSAIGTRVHFVFFACTISLLWTMGDRFLVYFLYHQVPLAVCSRRFSRTLLCL